ncbi:pyochelin biosynthetic protein PchC, partial [Streptomyces sp. Ncost-T6T-2b]
MTAALGGADGDGVGDGGPVVLFGHSMGAVLAYELAHRIARAGGPVRLAALVVSGAPGP